MSKDQADEFESDPSPTDVTEKPTATSAKNEQEEDPMADTNADDSQLGDDRASAEVDDAVNTAPDQETSIETELGESPEEGTEDGQEQLALEVQHYKDRWVRLAAEFDNYKKRTSREFGTLVKNAGETLITELLPILDNMERALQAQQTSDETRSFAQGFEMIHQQFQEKLEKVGMQEIMADGEPFDPTRHEAVMAIESGEHPADTVVNTVEKGYLLNEKVIRAAKVIVTRPPAKVQTNDNT